MNTKIIPPILSLLAGLVAIIVTYVSNAEVIEILTTLFFVLLSFYILGWIIKAVIDANMKEEPEEEEDEVELENIDTETADDQEEE